jgi:protein gp37
MGRLLPERWKNAPLKNVWLGVTAENQRRADERIPALLEVPAAVHWISAEPLLGPVDFSRFKGLDWLVVGGESGNGARRMDPSWARDILRYCKDAGVAYHFKQKGRILAAELGCKDREGKDFSEWPEEFKIQEFPRVA